MEKFLAGLMKRKRLYQLFMKNLKKNKKKSKKNFQNPYCSKLLKRAPSKLSLMPCSANLLKLETLSFKKETMETAFISLNQVN